MDRDVQEKYSIVYTVQELRKEKGIKVKDI